MKARYPYVPSIQETIPRSNRKPLRPGRPETNPPLQHLHRRAGSRFQGSAHGEVHRYHADQKRQRFTGLQGTVRRYRYNERIIENLLT